MAKSHLRVSSKYTRPDRGWFWSELFGFVGLMEFVGFFEFVEYLGFREPPPQRRFAQTH
jgi:hypothetical protein